MVTLQQQQAELLSKLELALTDHQAALERVRNFNRIFFFFLHVIVEDLATPPDTHGDNLR